MASPITIICFDYGGSYIKDGGERRWISGEDEIHTLVMKTAVEEITYFELVESICRKIKANRDGMVKISYFPMVLYSNKPSYIWCDEDVLGYLMQISSDMDDTYGGMSLSGDDDETDDSYVGLSDGDDDETDDSYVAEQHEDIEVHENLEHGYEGKEVRVEEEAARAEVEAARAGVEAARAGVEAARAVVEATTAVEEEWDDGLDLVTGQEFRTKVAMQVLIQRGAHKNGFERYPSAAAYLEKSVEVRKWARCYFEGDKYNVNTTNASESINGVLREARKFFLLPMIDVIIKKMTEWFNKHRKKAAEIPVTKKLVPTMSMVVTERFIRCFDIDKIPCVHAAAAAKFLSVGRDLHLQEFCSKYYLVELWALAYCRMIYHVPHMSEWVIPDEIRALKVLPPVYEKKKGPTQKQRFPSAGEPRGRRRGHGRGRGRGRGRRGERLYEYFECGSTSATTE
uniref:MULE transposase domain-containing protein n=1 Tax=Brassica oleracea var. oleracea TaxID=109376 RepID=A0A0D3C175_BRAOL